ncbi:MAG: hypothetical protein R2867_14950 [Caldilineaceae bacterium]
MRHTWRRAESHRYCNQPLPTAIPAAPRCQQAADPLALAEYAQQRKREQPYARAVRAFLHDLIRLRRRLPRLDQFPFENHAPIHDWQRGQAAQQNEAVRRRGLGQFMAG